MMREMLESEAVTFKGDAVTMEKHFWDPAESAMKSNATD
jgi:hypothetical protein